MRVHLGEVVPQPEKVGEPPLDLPVEWSGVYFVNDVRRTEDPSFH